MAETSEWVFESRFMFLSLDTGRDPDTGQILTTTDAPSAFALVGVRRGEVRKRSLLEGLFCLYLRYLQPGDRPVYLLASWWILGI